MIPLDLTVPKITLTCVPTLDKLLDLTKSIDGPIVPIGERGASLSEKSAK